MSPPTLKDQIEFLFTSITQALFFCRYIRTVHTFTSIPTRLNHLEASLQSAPQALIQSYLSSREASSSSYSKRFDDGDNITFQACIKYLEEFERGVVAKLKVVAESGARDVKRSPGFGRMSEVWESVRIGVVGTVEGWAGRMAVQARMEAEQEKEKQALVVKSVAKVLPMQDVYENNEVVMSREDFEELMKWRKSCWYEGIDWEGRRVWINCVDRRRCWVMPTGDFVTIEARQEGRMRRSNARG